MAITFEGGVSDRWAFDYCFSFEERNRLMYHLNRNSVALIPKENPNFLKAERQHLHLKSRRRMQIQFRQIHHLLNKNYLQVKLFA